MGLSTYAASIHHFINSVGASAGFAALIGLAILVLLYFAQARETSALREQAQEWAQRVQQLEARLAVLTRGQASAETRAPTQPLSGIRAAGDRIGGASPVAPAAAPVSARAQTTGSPGAPAAATPSALTGTGAPPGAPAGVAAPALTAATKLIPSPTRATPAETAVMAAATGGQIDEVATRPPVPALASAAGNGAGSERMPSPASYAGSLSAPGVGSPPPPPPRGQPRTSAPGPRPAAPLRGLGLQPGPTRRTPRALVVLLAGIVIAAIVAGLLTVTSNSGNSTTSTSNANAQARRNPTSGAAFSPSSVTVVVLNGTATAGLAANVSHRLIDDGYRKGMVGNASDETHTSTVVAYRSGYQRDALAVAKSLGLSNASVQQVDQGTLAIACPPHSPCTANVVVTVGADFASRA